MTPTIPNNEIIISLINTAGVTGNRVVDAGYMIVVDGKRKKRCLLDNLDVVETDEKTDVQKAEITLTQTNAFAWKINLSLPHLTEKKVEKLIQWVSEHPDILDGTGKRSSVHLTGEPLVQYIITSEVVDNQYSEDEQKVAVFQKFDLLEADEKEAIGVHFGFSPWGQTPKEVRNKLVGLVDGIITSSTEFRDEFLNRMEQILDNVSLNLRAAVQTGVVDNSDGVFRFNGIFLGESFDKAYSELSLRPDLFALLRRHLQDKGCYINVGRKRDEKPQPKGVELPEGEFAAKRGRKPAVAEA